MDDQGLESFEQDGATPTQANDQVQRPATRRVRCNAMLGSDASRFRDAQVSADLAGQRVRDLGVSRDRRTTAVSRIAPP